MADRELSPFRTGYLKVALFVSGAWVDVPMTDLQDEGVRIVRGRKNESGLGEPAIATLSLKDPTGKWSPRNPNSPYFGLIGRATRLRVQVEMTSGVVKDRFYGRVVTWQPRWTKKGSASARVDVEAAGILRKLGQGTSPLRSPIYRGRSTIGANLVAYWPCEDASGARSLAHYTGINPMKITGSPTLSTFTGFLGSDPLPTLGTAQLTAGVKSYTGGTQLRWLSRLTGAIPTGTVLARLTQRGGTLARIDVAYAGGGNVSLQGYNADGTSVGVGVLALAVDGKNLQLSLELATSGANVVATLALLEAGQFFGIFASVTMVGVTVGRAASVTFNPNRANLADVPVGHVTVEKVITSVFALDEQLNGYLGERADTRIARLCAENGLTFALQGITDAAAMGPQTSQDLISLLRECAETDGGILFEPRDSTTDLAYRTLETLYAQAPVVVPYVENRLLPFEPVEDDEAVRNLVTVTRIGGSSSTVEEAAGPLGTAELGIYDDAPQLSLAADEDAEQQAGWRVHLGTLDEARWPVLGWDFAHPTLLADTALRDALLDGIDLGDRLDVPTPLPAWLPPVTVSQIVQGYTETLQPLHYRVQANCVPARNYQVGKYNTTTDRYTNDATTTAASITTSATSFTVTVASGPIWSSADGAFRIVLAGEEITVGVVSGAGPTQTFSSCTRAVNGVVRAHVAGEVVQLADPDYYGL